MTALKRQYFFSYAVIGSVMPLMTVFLRDEAFSFLQIGIAYSIMNLPMLFSPVLITLVADRNVDTRRILAIAFLLSGLVLSGIFFSDSIRLTLGLYFFHGLAFVAMIPLQDGFYFSLREELLAKGQETADYPFVRVWGTIGFMVPSLILFLPLRNGADPSSILPVAVLFCVLSLANSFTLPKLSQPYEMKPVGRRQIPTGKAFRKLYSHEGRWLAVGLFFGLFAASVYYAFIANYFDEVIQIPRQYIGLIFNIGVMLEIGYSLLMPRLQKWIGLKGIISVGLGLMATRMFLLAFFPSPLMAIVTQIMHGLEVLALFLAPPMFINRLAGNEFRNSMQGVFTMTVGGFSRVIAGVVAGLINTSWGLKGGLYFGSALAFTAFLIITILFGRIPPREERDS